MPPSTEAAEASDREARKLAGVVLLLGLLLQLGLTFRSWIYFDQILLYQLGVNGLESGRLFPYAKAVSGSGVIPGSLLEVLIAAPLHLWLDLRAPILALGVSQLLAALILWRTVARHFGERIALTYLAIYWLGPWRLYHSGFLWEPTYLLLPAAAHLWASLQLVERPRRGPSLVLGAVAVAAVQLHPSGVVLGASTVLLWLAGKQKLSLPAASLGALLASCTLWPTLGALRDGSLPRAVPGGSWTEWGLFQLHPLLKDLLYWLRLGSLDVGRRLRQLELEGPWLGAAALLGLLAAASVLLVLLANLRWVREAPTTSAQRFVRTYAGALLACHLIAMAFSTVTPQGWHLLVLLHVACVPVALYVADVVADVTRGPSRALRVACLAFLFFRLPIVLLLGFAHPMYQRPEGDPNAAHVEAGRLEDLELVPIPFGSDASERGPVPWEP